MKTNELTEAVKSLAEYAIEALVEPVMVAHEGRPLVVLSSVIGDDAESVSLSTNRNFMELIEKSRKSLRESGGISGDEMRRWVEALEQAGGEDAEPIDLSRAPRLKEILDAAREDYKRRGGVSASEVRRRILGESETG
jgi:hypothetical protein